MKMIVGLGNPGRKYEGTRHNVGFRVINKIIKEVSVSPRAYRRILAQVYYWHSQNVILAKPTVFMNESGKPVANLLKKFKVSSTQLGVVHDDLDLPLGKIRIQVGGSAAGHHGVESIIEEIGTKDFVRFRLGIGRPGKISNIKYQISNIQIEEFVLSEFTKEERPVVEKMVEETLAAIKMVLKEGVEKAASRFN